MDTVIAYFGCWGQAGHFLWDRNHRQIDRFAETFLLPNANIMDGTRVFLPREKVGDGCLTFLPGPNRTVMAWWGNNPWDQRGKVNQAIITNGDLPESAMWQRFVRHFPALSEQLTRPTIVGPEVGT